jgi:ComEC/Rec2-related protein
VVWCCATALAAGIAGSAWLAGATVALMVLEGRAARRSGPFAALVCLAVLFWLFGHSAIRPYNDQIRRFDRWAEHAARGDTLRGWVCGLPEKSYGGTRFCFRTRIDGLVTDIRVQATAFGVHYGDSLEMQVKPRARGRRDPASDIRFRVGLGVAGLASTKQPLRVLPGHHGNPLIRRVFAPLHERVRDRVTRGLGASAALPVALLVGERGQLDSATRKAFVRLGISHLLALSGLHLGFVVLLVMLLMRVLRIRNPLFVGGVAAFYAGVVGYLPSLDRALLMTIVLVVASRLHRPLRPMASLGHAFVLMLLAFPHALYALAFQLSFLATFAVLVWVTRWCSSCFCPSARRISVSSALLPRLRPSYSLCRPPCC